MCVRVDSVPMGPEIVFCAKKKGSLIFVTNLEIHSQIHLFGRKKTDVSERSEFPTSTWKSAVNANLTSNLETWKPKCRCMMSHEHGTAREMFTVQVKMYF